MTHPVHAPPKAAILIESMRDIGYTLDTALADVLDNSLSAGAKEIHILVDSISPDPAIGILDNGRGMTQDELMEAMRLGSRSPKERRSRNDLGRFGLGMKTASFSQCRRLTVLSRKNGEFAAATWDLDFVEKSDNWLLIIPDEPSAVPFAERLTSDGCLVVWEKLDRAFEGGGSESARRHFIAKIDDARSHLQLVYHRFLKGEPGLPRVRMWLNEVPLKPFDPFNSDHEATQKGQQEVIQIGAQRVTITPFTLPHHRNISKADWDAFAGPNGYTRNQGFYLYRERRLIVYGTWFGLARQAELTKLSRVRIDVPNTLDELWNIDVKKAWAKPPAQVLTRLREIIQQLAAPSRRVYTQRGARLHDAQLPIWQRVQENNKITYRVNPDNPFVKEFIGTLPESHQAGMLRFANIISAALPMDGIFADLAASPEQIENQKVEDDELRTLVKTTYQDFALRGFAADVIADFLRIAEPFRSNWDRTESLLTSMQRAQA
jgi:hypothetical protein